MAQAIGPYSLIDSSAWIPALRRGTTPIQTRLRQRIAQLLSGGSAAITGMVRMELLKGARDAAQYRYLQALFAGLHQLPVAESTWDAAGDLGMRLRQVGIVVQSTDLVIAAVAMEHGATVVHRDADFDLIAQHAPLAVESYV